MTIYMTSQSRTILNAKTQTRKFAAASTSVLNWYDLHARDLPWRVGPAEKQAGTKPDPYFVWLSEIMLQQTTVPAVKDYFIKFTSLWPHVFDLADAPTEDVMAAWAGLGYYARARNLHACAKLVAYERNGIFPTKAVELQELPGIGPYTSAAIAAICHDEQVGVLDGNVERVLARFLALETPVREVKNQLRSILDASVPSARSGDYAQALMDLGATICAPKRTMCDLCPITQDCTGRQSGNPLQFPVAAPKRAKPERFGDVFIIRDSAGQIIVQRRPPKGLLGGMHEFLGTEWADTKPQSAFPFQANWRSKGQVKHVFTHFALYLNVWVSDEPAPRSWLDENRAKIETVDAERLDNLALPSLFKKVAVKADLY